MVSRSPEHRVEHCSLAPQNKRKVHCPATGAVTAPVSLWPSKATCMWLPSPARCAANPGQMTISPRPRPSSAASHRTPWLSGALHWEKHSLQVQVTNSSVQRGASEGKAQAPFPHFGPVFNQNFPILHLGTLRICLQVSADGGYRCQARLSPRISMASQAFLGVANTES